MEYFGNKSLLNDWFVINDFQLNNISIKYYSLQDNYKLDEFCQVFYEKFKRNPYFVNKWYSTEKCYKFLLEEFSLNKLNKFDVLELGSGLGLTGVFIHHYFKNIFSLDYEFLSCCLSNKTSKLNSINNIFNLCCDWKYLPFKNRFKIIIGLDIIYEIENIQPIINCLNSVLDTNGFFYLANFNNIALSDFVRCLSLNPDFAILLKKKVRHHNKQICIYKILKKP
ncbi:MAG TPA: hypothetical protein PKY81_02260 [bacterium]|nr:hypothetical protein [bacterium]